MKRNFSKQDWLKFVLELANQQYQGNVRLVQSNLANMDKLEGWF